jgi:hypothetical protein
LLENLQHTTNISVDFPTDVAIVTHEIGRRFALDTRRLIRQVAWLMVNVGDALAIACMLERSGGRWRPG